jgi:DNA polymerase elongation subunit (family B)
MYPNIAISNNIYPEHLSQNFAVIYKELYEERKKYPKGTPENLMIKLSLNSAYGKSNDKHSFLYDPKFTMSVTLNGQLSLLLLVDRLICIQGLKIVQVNTDGVTVALPRDKEQEYKDVCQKWQKDVKLELEFADYSKMFIRDVNNYVALYTNTKVKYKGAYVSDGLGWHQNQSSMVIQKAACAKMLYGTDLKEFISKHYNDGNIFDFMLRTKVDRSSRLITLDENNNETEEQRICRYYISNKGKKLVKIMKPLNEGEVDRRFAIDSEWLVTTCNDMQNYKGDVNFEYYIKEAEKLVIS